MGTKNLAVPSILKCQTGLGKAAESTHFWQTADEEAGERQVQTTDKSHLQNSPGFGWKAVLWFLSGSSSGANVWGREPSQGAARMMAPEQVRLKVRDVRRCRRMPRLTGSHAAASEAQNAPNPASSSWHLSSSHKMTTGFQQPQTRAE